MASLAAQAENPVRDTASNQHVNQLVNRDRNCTDYRCRRKPECAAVRLFEYWLERE